MRLQIETQINKKHKYNDILITEFKYYNQKTNVIKNEILNKIEQKILNNEEKKIFWTNKKFADNCVGFYFYKIEQGTDENKKTNVYISMLKLTKKINVDDFKNIKDIYNNNIFFGFELTNDKINYLDLFNFARYNHPNRNGRYLPPFKNYNELVDELIQSRVLSTFYGYYDSEWNNYQNMCKKLFNIILEKPKVNHSYSYSYTTQKIYYIIDVIEKRINNINWRVALTIKLDQSSYYKISVFNENDKEYVYIDKKRLYIKSLNNEYYFFDLATNEYRDGHIIVNSKLLIQIGKNINEIVPNDECIITPMIYRFYRERVLTSDFYDSRLSMQEEKLFDKYKQLLTNGKTIKIENIYINTKMIKIHNEGFIMKFDSKFLDVIKNFNNIKKLIKSDIRYNFNEFYEGLIKLSSVGVIKQYEHFNSKYKNFKKANFTINNMKIHIIKNNKRLKINNIFSRINDTLHILNKAICYNDVNEYNKYIKDVSYIGIEWMKMINNGVVLQLNNPLYNIFSNIGTQTFENTLLRFSLRWDKEKRNIVYLRLNNKDYKIQYKGKFKYYFNFPKRSLRIEELKHDLDECIYDMDNERILEIVDNAIEEAKIVKKRGVELVKYTIHDVKAKETTITIQGNELIGYIFNGRQTNSKYFVEKLQLNVYIFSEGSWNRRCIVDDHNKQRIYEDKLANRLINVYNEPSYLANFLKA